MKFNYTYKQKNGKISTAQVELDNVIHAKVIKFDEDVTTETGVTQVEKEVITLELNHNHQQAIEVPIEQAATKEQRIQGIRNFSHSKWELGWVPFTVHVAVEEDVVRLKEILGL